MVKNQQYYLMMNLNKILKYDKYNTNMVLLRSNKISCSTNENKHGEK